MSNSRFIAADKRGRLPSLADLPTPLRTLYVDGDATNNGTGAIGSPFNSWAAALAAAQPGDRILFRGVLRSGAAGTAFSVATGGTLGAPVQLIGASSWGRARLDASVPVTTAACTSQANAMGNPRWAQLRRATLPQTDTVPENGWLHVLYGNGRRRYVSQCPAAERWTGSAWAYDPEAWEDVTGWPTATSADLWWPASAQGTGVGLTDAAEGRFPLSIAAAGASPGRSMQQALRTRYGQTQGDAEYARLLTALRADQFPLIMIWCGANILVSGRLVRCNADGAPNWTSGEWVKAVGMAEFGTLAARRWENSVTARASDNRWAIFNLSDLVDRPGQYAYHPVDLWAVYEPLERDEAISRATGRDLLDISADHVVVRGFELCGRSTRQLRDGAVNLNVGGGTSIKLTGVRRGVDVSDNFDLGDNSFRNRGGAFFDGIGGANATSLNFHRDLSIRRNLVGGTLVSAGVLAGNTVNLTVEFNDFDGVNGTCYRQVGGVHVLSLAVRGNRIRRNKGIHSNGITIYGRVYRVVGQVATTPVVSGNLVSDTARPVTINLQTTDGDTTRTSITAFGDTWTVEEALAINDNDLATADAMFGAPCIDFNRSSTDNVPGPNVQVTNNRLNGAATGKAMDIGVEQSQAAGFLVTGNRAVGQVAVIDTSGNSAGVPASWSNPVNDNQTVGALSTPATPVGCPAPGPGTGAVIAA